MKPEAYDRMMDDKGTNIKGYAIELDELQVETLKEYYRLETDGQIRELLQRLAENWTDNLKFSRQRG